MGPYATPQLYGCDLELAEPPTTITTTTTTQLATVAAPTCHIKDRLVNGDIKIE